MSDPYLTAADGFEPEEGGAAVEEGGPPWPVMDPVFFYGLDSTKPTMKEYSFGTPVLLLPIAAVVKACKVRLASSTDELNVTALEPFETPWEAMPSDVQQRLAAWIAELRQLGFTGAICHWVEDPLNQTSQFMVTMGHPTGRTCARLHERDWRYPKKPRRYYFVEFVSALGGGEYLWTTGAKPDVFPAPECKVARLVGGRPTALWEMHQKRLAEDVRGRSATATASEEGMRTVMAGLQETMRANLVERGIFAPLTEQQQATMRTVAGWPVPAEAGDLKKRESDVYVEVMRLQGKRGGGSGIMLLALTVAVFAAMGAAAWDWEFVAIIIPILFVHELGHYLTMLMFGYRNLKMFFIPMLGAGVTGNAYNVAGWKKVLVYLAGPVPGIVAGTVLGLAGLALDVKWLTTGSLMAVLLNGFNLLPIYPLDGGRVLHALVFARLPMLDVVFRAVAAVGIIGLGMLVQDRFFMGLGVVFLLVIPAALVQARVIEKMRRSGMDFTSPDGKTMPAAAARAIIAQQLEISKGSQTIKDSAQATEAIYQVLNTRVPHWGTSLGLGTVYAGGTFATVVVALVLLLASSFNLRGLIGQMAMGPTTDLNVKHIARSAGQEASAAGVWPRVVLVVECDSAGKARQLQEVVSRKLGARETATLFGKHVLVGLPEADEAAREKWVQELEHAGSGFQVVTSDLPVSMTCMLEEKGKAEEVEEDISGYSLGLGVMDSVAPMAPWSKRREELSAGEWDEYRKLRRQYLTIRKMLELEWDEPRLVAERKKMANAERVGDKKKMAALREEQRQLVQELMKENQLKVRAMTELDQELAELALALSAEEMGVVDEEEDVEATKARADAFLERTKRRNELQKQIWEKLGRLPLENGQVTGADAAEAASWIVVSRTDFLLTIHCGFRDPEVGLRQMTQWLAAQGGKHFMYEISMFPREEEAEEK